MAILIVGHTIARYNISFIHTGYCSRKSKRKVALFVSLEKKRKELRTKQS